MGFLRRSSSTPRGASEGEAIAKFWSWWQAEGAEQTALAIVDSEPQRMVAALSDRINAVHKGLSWELGPGRENANVLMVSAEGNPELRGIARRWLRAAPAADGLWEYSDTRLPAADPTQVILTLEDTEIPVGIASAAARVAGADLNVTVYHPAFADLSEQQRTLAGFLLLDTVLGESAVETWVGTIDTTTHEPLDPVPLAGLRAVIRELAERFTDADGEPAWVLMEGSTQDGDRVLASAQIPLRSATAPQFDTRIAVSVPYTDRTPDGLPTSESLSALQKFTDHLIDRLGESGKLVAHETHGGIRLLHFYVDGGTPAAEQLRPAITGWGQGEVSIAAAADPGWQLVQHLRG